MKVCVNTVKKSNKSHNCGEWVNLADFNNKDEFLDYCHDIHHDEENPVFTFQYVSDVPVELIDPLNDYIFSWAQLHSKLSSEDFEALIEFAIHTHSTLQVDAYSVQDEYEESFCGHMTLSEYAYVVIHECYDVPDGLSLYIDYDRYALDLESEGYFEIDCKVFRPI